MFIVLTAVNVNDVVDFKKTLNFVSHSVTKPCTTDQLAFSTVAGCKTYRLLFSDRSDYTWYRLTNAVTDTIIQPRILGLKVLRAN